MKINMPYLKYRFTQTILYSYIWNCKTSCYIACRFVLEGKSQERAVKILDRWNRISEYKSRMQYRRVSLLIARLSEVSGKPEWEIRSEYGL